MIDLKNCYLGKVTFKMTECDWASEILYFRLGPKSLKELDVIKDNFVQGTITKIDAVGMLLTDRICDSFSHSVDAGLKYFRINNLLISNGPNAPRAIEVTDVRILESDDPDKPIIDML